MILRSLSIDPLCLSMLIPRFLSLLCKAFLTNEGYQRSDITDGSLNSIASKGYNILFADLA